MRLRVGDWILVLDDSHSENIRGQYSTVFGVTGLISSDIGVLMVGWIGGLGAGERKSDGMGGGCC